MLMCLVCYSGGQRVDQYLQWRVEDLRLWHLQTISWDQPLHRDLHW